MSAHHPTIDEMFKRVPIRELNPQNFDSEIKNATKDFSIVFFWGIDCPNCEVAKKSLHVNEEDLVNLPYEWFHVNAYEHSDLANRFGLHGIPVFFIFKKEKRIGKITSFPGWEPFIDTLKKQALR